MATEVTSLLMMCYSSKLEVGFLVRSGWRVSYSIRFLADYVRSYSDIELNLLLFREQRLHFEGAFQFFLFVFFGQLM